MLLDSKLKFAETLQNPGKFYHLLIFCSFGALITGHKALRCLFEWLVGPTFVKSLVCWIGMSCFTRLTSTWEAGCS